MPVNARRVPTIRTRISWNILNRNVPMRTIMVVVGAAVLLMLIGAWLQPPLQLWFIIAPVVLGIAALALSWKPRGLPPEEYLRRKLTTLWVPRRMAWAPRGAEEEVTEVAGIAVQPLVFDEQPQEGRDGQR